MLTWQGFCLTCVQPTECSRIQRTHTLYIDCKLRSEFESLIWIQFVLTTCEEKQSEKISLTPPPVGSFPDPICWIRILNLDPSPLHLSEILNADINWNRMHGVSRRNKISPRREGIKDFFWVWGPKNPPKIGGKSYSSDLRIEITFNYVTYIFSLKYTYKHITNVVLGWSFIFCRQTLISVRQLMSSCLTTLTQR